MNSGSREYDFNAMADMGKQVSENKKALDDVRSSFVGPTQEEEAPPEPTPVILDGPATDEADNKVNLNELAYAAKRHLEEVGHPAADMLMTPANIKKLAEFENKRQRVERERLAYEEDPEGYDLNSANALDAYIKSWNLKHLSPEQLHPGPSTWKPGAADEAAPTPVDKEVPRVAPDRGEAMPVVRDGPSGGEAPTPRRQSTGSSERPAPARSVPESKPSAPAPKKGPSKTNNGITTGPVRPSQSSTTQPVERSFGPAERKARAKEVMDYRKAHGGMTPANADVMPTMTYEKSSPSEKAFVDATQETPWGIEANLPKHVRTGGGAAGEVMLGEMGPMTTKAGQRVGAALETAKATATRPAVKPAVNNNISRVSKPPGLAVRDMISEQRAAQTKSGYTPPGEKGYKPPTKAELDDVRYQNKVNVKAKKMVNPDLKSKASQKRAKKEGK